MRFAAKSINIGWKGSLQISLTMYHTRAEVGDFNETDLKLKHPFSFVLAGARRTGNAQLIKRIILNNSDIINPPIEHIWFYASEQENVFSEIKKELGNDHTEFVKVFQLMQLSKKRTSWEDLDQN